MLLGRNATITESVKLAIDKGKPFRSTICVARLKLVPFIVSVFRLDDKSVVVDSMDGAFGIAAAA